MGFKSIRSDVIEMLRSGNIQHEVRNAIDIKNMLSIGEKSPEDVIEFLKLCRGNQYSTMPHKDDATVTVHVFKPVVDKVEWYIKCYILEPDVWFISVHQS